MHCINDVGLFETIYDNHDPVYITVANGKRVRVVRLKLIDKQISGGGGVAVRSLLFATQSA